MTPEPDHGGGGGHGNDEVRVTIDGIVKMIHRGDYTTEQLKAALGVAPQRDLDIVEDGVFRPLLPGERIVVRDGMEFISRQPAGGSS